MCTTAPDFKFLLIRTPIIGLGASLIPYLNFTFINTLSPNTANSEVLGVWTSTYEFLGRHSLARNKQDTQYLLKINPVFANTCLQHSYEQFWKSKVCLKWICLAYMIMNCKNGGVGYCEKFPVSITLLWIFWAKHTFNHCLVTSPLLE